MQRNDLSARESCYPINFLNAALRLRERIQRQFSQQFHLSDSLGHRPRQPKGQIARVIVRFVQRGFSNYRSDGHEMKSIRRKTI